MTFGIKKFDKKFWHKWFAWHPVTIGDTVHWLEKVWRRNTGDTWTSQGNLPNYIYRKIEEQ